MRIGIFGGSFDPIHAGHLVLAEQCREQARLDQVWFVPASTGPHKRQGACSTDRQRCEMIELALAGHDAFRLSKIEIERGGISYTIDTLNQVRQDHPHDELFFLIGGDSLNDFHTWQQPEEILKLAVPLIVNRPGAGTVDYAKLRTYVDQQHLSTLEQNAIESPLIEVSSSDIRQRVQAGKSIRYQLPRAVEKYIETQKLYVGT